MYTKTNSTLAVILLAGLWGCGTADPSLPAISGTGGAYSGIKPIELPSTTSGTTSSTTVSAGSDKSGLDDSLYDPSLNRCNWTLDQGTCAGEMFSGQVPPLDIHILFDQSGSMALKDDGVTRRIEAVRGALNQFFQAPESKGIGVGLAFFGYHPLSCACTSCNPADYTKPVVAVAELPNHASTLTAALATIEPTGETPTGAALRGACAYARSAMSTRTDRQLTVLLVTDGDPQAPLTAAKGTCMPTIGDAIDASAECEKGSPSVRVFVLGVGPSLQNLNYIAAAGGTASAYLVEGGGGRDILNALNQIRRDAQIPCTLDIPKPNHAALDFNKVNVIYGDSKCNLTTLVRVDSAATCFGVKDGWYYDHPDHPTRVRLCESTCKMVSQPMGQLRIAMGCQTIIIP